MKQNTLQAMRNAGCRVLVHCEGPRGCSHSYLVEVDILIVAFGPGFETSASDLSERMICKSCGRKGMSATIMPAGQ